MMTPSREDAATIAALEREIHRLRCELEQADARARTWRRVAQWIWTANLPASRPWETAMTRFCWCDTDCCEGNLDLPCPARDRWLEIDDSEMET